MIWENTINQSKTFDIELINQHAYVLFESDIEQFDSKLHIKVEAKNAMLDITITYEFGQIESFSIPIFAASDIETYIKMSINANSVKV